MHDGHLVTEAPTESSNCLRCKRNLGNKHACRSSRSNNSLDGAKVDLRLPRTRHAVDENHFAVFMTARFDNGVESRLLTGC